MQEAVNSGNVDHVADLAHKMLSPSRHIGANGLCNLLKKIEENVHKKIEPNNLEMLTRESLLEFEVVSGLIKEHVANIS
jgi:polysaccharide pyruvyl transferase WcaK-like protein